MLVNLIVPHGFEKNYTVGFVRGLVANEVDLTVVSGYDDDAALRRVGANTVNLRGGQDSSRQFLRKLTNLIWYYVRLVGFVVANRGAVIHFTGIFRTSLLFWDGIVLSFLFRSLSTKYIYTVHNVLPHGRDNDKRIRWLYRVAYKIPDTLVVHTTDSKRRLVEDFGVSEEQVRVISIGLNEEFPITDVNMKTAREKLGLPQEDKVILFFGKADEYKGLDILIQAFDLLGQDGIALAIAAWFPTDAYRTKVYSAIAGATNRSRVRLFEGFVPNEMVEIYFKSANVLCLPYRHVYQSGLIFLSMRLGTPIVATSVGAFPEYVSEDVGILTEKCSPKEIAAALTAFFSAEPHFQRDRIISLAGKYKWESVCRPLLSLYS